jgi:hypothetical protein
LPETKNIQSFERLNRFFLDKLGDESHYRGTHFSFLKIFQHALHNEQIGSHKRIIANYLHWPFWAHASLLRFKALVRKPLPKIALKEIVFIDPARIVPDNNGVWHSIYMEKISSLFPSQHVTNLNRKTEPRLENAVALDKLPRHFGAPNAPELEMLREVTQVAQLVRSSLLWSAIQKKHILSALHLFYDDFRFYYSLFRNQSVKSVVFISHYHNEGLIAAMQVLKIRSVELQHGLIAGNDLYYQYDAAFRNAVKNAFFPDIICVYGPYWKHILLKGCEFSESNITIAGDYLWHPPISNQGEVLKKNTVLICAQKNFHTDYVNYALSLVPLIKKHPQWNWIIKLHPLEQFTSAYHILKEHGFEVVGQERSLTTLLRESRIHISIYSTTFFDALGYDVTNFSLQNYSTAKDYAAQMVAEGVAHPLSIDEDPIEIATGGKLSPLRLTRGDVYSSFDDDAIRKALLNEVI